MLELELRGLTRERYFLYGKVDNTVATSRDLRRLQEVNTQISRIEFQIAKLKKCLKGCD